MTIMEIVIQHLIVTNRQNSVRDANGEQQMEDGKTNEGDKVGKKLEQKMCLWCKIIFPCLYALAVVILFMASF